MADSRPPERFEQMLSRLEGLVRALEAEELDLEHSIAAFEEGVALSRECRRRLDVAERRVELLQRDADGKLTSEPLTPTAVPPEGG